MGLQSEAEKPPSIKSFDSEVLTLKKRHSPFFRPKPFWDYQDFEKGLQNAEKKRGLIEVEMTEPIVRRHQGFPKQNEDVGLQNTLYGQYILKSL